MAITMEQSGGDLIGSVGSDLAATALALARRFAAGATLWCWAPSSPEHAQHVAVEFVHPVVVGTRALPAVAIEGDAAARLRPLARAGDVLLVIAGDADREVDDLLRRVQAWGLHTVRIGTGVRPPPGAVDHLVWLSPDPFARHDGRLILSYHLLWELTQVCFEHPGLLEGERAQGDVCVTCSDEGRLGEVVDSRTSDATVRTAAGVETIDTTVVGPVRAGDLVLVHAGTAITVVDP
ncbi:MAG: HypC/HybG/HupF family hydrogenase formation chaperone [Acidimicrobiales bacterium]